MIPAAFQYERPASLEEAGDLMRRHGEEAKLLAGGQSLIPQMRFRRARPRVVVDITRIPSLGSIEIGGDRRLHIGALARHVDIQDSPVVKQSLPLLADIASEVADNQVRNLGTLGGVLAYADPAGDYCALARMLDAEIVTNQRTIPAGGFFVDQFTTTLGPDEIVREVVFPVAAGPHRYIKFRRRVFDWSIVGVLVQQLDTGWRVGLINVGLTPVRAERVEAALAAGASPREAAAKAGDGLHPLEDIRATPDYKKHLARVLTRRALEEA